MKRRLFLILLTGILTLMTYGYAFAKEPVDTRGTGLKYVTEFEGGKLYGAGTIKVVELTGSYPEGYHLPGGRCPRAVEDMAQGARFAGLDGDPVKTAFREMRGIKNPVNARITFQVAKKGKAGLPFFCRC